MRQTWRSQELDGITAMRAEVDVELGGRRVVVHLFGAGSLLQRVPEWLVVDDEDRARVACMRVEDDRRRFWTGRALVVAGTRAVCGDVGGCRFVAEHRDAGTSKPEWTRGPTAVSSGPLPFVSISHAASVVVVAVCVEAEVGVDVQDVAAFDNAGGLTGVMFAEDERRRLTSVGNVADAFTAKEAVLKAVGWGLAIDPKLLRLNGERVVAFDAPQAREIGVKRVSLPAGWGGFAAHVAVADG